MANRSYMVAYDIANPKRLHKVNKLLKGYGERWQKSIFYCHIGTTRRKEMEIRLLNLIHQCNDQVMVIDLGANQKNVKSQISFFGKTAQKYTPRILVL